jgi:hypothetical protein
VRWTAALATPMIRDAMGIGAETPARARRARTIVASRALRAVVVTLGLGCGEATLDGPGRGSDAGAPTSTGDTLPPLDTGEPASSGEASTGEPQSPDDPRWCPVDCTIVLPERWVYEGAPPQQPLAPGPHGVPAMLREPDGAFVVAELRGGEARLHRVGHDGTPQGDVTLPLPCDPCELTDVAPHPAGDLLVSAAGVVDGAHILLAARYDPARHALVWLTTSPLEPVQGVHVRSGGIAALPGELTAQLFLRADPFFEFDIQQSTLMVAYGPTGRRLDEVLLVTDGVTPTRPPLLARTAPDGTLLVGLFYGAFDGLRGLTTRLAPPLWQAGYAIMPVAYDDIALDAQGRAFELGHVFDGSHVYLVLGERTNTASSLRWKASVALASTTARPGALALGPDGDVYTATRTTQVPGGVADPLVSVSLSRWTPQGELRWSTTLLHAVADSFCPLELAVDGDEGLVVAAVVGDRLRVERRAQHCACPG